jgi:hypothetical protein
MNIVKKDVHNLSTYEQFINRVLNISAHIGNVFILEHTSLFLISSHP